MPLGVVLDAGSNGILSFPRNLFISELGGLGDGKGEKLQRLISLTGSNRFRRFKADQMQETELYEIAFGRFEQDRIDGLQSVKNRKKMAFLTLSKKYCIFIFSPSKHPLDQHKTIARMKEHHILYRMVYKGEKLTGSELLQKSPESPHPRFQSKRFILRFALLREFP